MKSLAACMLALALALGATTASAQYSVEPGGRDYSLTEVNVTQGPFYYQSENELRARKLARGVANVVLAVGEVPNQMFQEAYRTTPVTGAVVGFGRGLLKGVKRIAVGTWEVATFYLPGRTEYGPIIEPEVVFQEHLH